MGNDNNDGGFCVQVYGSGNNIAKEMTITYNGDVFNGQAERPKKTYSDEQIAEALIAINGKEKVLNNYQLWLGACCFLMARCHYPKDLELCCNKITGLPYGINKLEFDCKYENIRKLNYLKFVNTDIAEWDDYEPKDDEKKLFYGCKAVMKELDKMLPE